MNYELFKKAMQITSISSVEKITLLLLCYEANDENVSLCSFLDISKKCCYSKKTAINTIKSLEKKGFIEKNNTYIDGCHSGNAYYICVNNFLIF